MRQEKNETLSKETTKDKPVQNIRVIRTDYRSIKKQSLLQDFKYYLYLKIKETRKSILIPALCLIIFGLLMSFSLSYSVSKKLETGDFYFFYKHLFFVICGLCSMAFFALVDFKKIINISLFAYIFCLFLLVLVLFTPGSVKGAQRWIDFGFLSIQPSEVLKPFFIVIHSIFIFKYWQKNDINYFLTHLAIFAGIAFLFALEPDYGMIIIYSATIGIQVLFSHIKTKYVVLFGLATFVFLILASLCFEHVRFRILTFVGLGDGDNYQLRIALSSIKKGGFLGSGIGESLLKYRLPDAHNDFIFAVIGEELGFFGYTLLITFYGTMFLSILMFLSEEGDFMLQNQFKQNELSIIDDYYMHRIIIMSIFAMFFIALTINSFVSLGLFPTKGMTLPLVSYGGSSMLSHSILIGILLNLTKTKYRYHRRVEGFV
jgi:cell division protein FtsW